MVGRPAAPLPNAPNRIREWRLRLGFTQERIGEALGVHGETIRKWETGDNPISVDQLGRIAALLGLRPLDLLNT